MSSLLPFLHVSTTAALAGALFASLWQGSLLVLLVSLGLRLLQGLTAAARAWIWVAVLAVVAAHPLLALAGVGASSSTNSAGLVHAAFGCSVALVGVWAMASLFRLFQLVISGAELWRTLRSARPLAAPAAVTALLREAPRRPVLCSSDLVNRPCVAGFFRPRLLLPADLLPGLKEAELLQIALHELEHLRRGDDWVNLLQQAALVVLPLHPAMFWVNRRLALERELACDDAVLTATRAGKAYAACLAHVAEQSLMRRGLSLAVGALGRRRSELTARVERILRRPERTLSGVPLRLATGLVLLATVFAGGALERSPALVSFGAEADPIVALAMVHGAEFLPGAQIVPVVSRVGDREMSGREMSDRGMSDRGMSGRGVTAPHAVLLNAAMPVTVAAYEARRSGGRVHSTVVPRVHRAGVSRAGSRRRGRVLSAPWLVLTRWDEGSFERRTQAADESEPRMVPVVYAPRLERVVVVETQQVWYSAIRYGDGWMVVQL